jgi:hypothetical protein
MGGTPAAVDLSEAGSSSAGRCRSPPLLCKFIGSPKNAVSLMLRRVALLRTDVSEELIAVVIRLTIIDELETTFAVSSNRSTLLDPLIEVSSF